MGKRRKTAGPRLADDPHGWLVDVLQREEQHSVKAQRAVSALTGFEYIAGTEQGASTNRPFDHKAKDDSIRIDTKTQQAGLLDVKQEKLGKQFTAWARADKKFIPVQLVLDSLTNSWYVVPGIPRKTLGLDPLATDFDPTDPLSPFKIADGCLDDLLDKAVFLALQVKVLAAFSCLLAEKEVIMKVIDADYQLYLKSTAEDLAENPELMQAIAANEDAMRTIAANENAMRALAANDKAMRALAANDDAMRAIAANDDAMLKLLGPELFEAWKKTRLS